MQETTREAFKKYCEVLDKEYISKEEQNERMYQNLKNEYIEAKSNLYKEIEKIVNELDEMKKTRVAAIEAKRREKELAAQKDFYCLQLNDAEVADISRLEGIRAQFSQPRTISMLI